MKLRLRPNSIRLRLQQSDLRELVSVGRCTRTITFGAASTQKFGYTLQTAETHDVTARMEGCEIVVTLPRQQVATWASTDLVGIEATQQTGGEPLRILIEKDFECIDGNDDEPQDDAFPNPLANCGPSRG